MKRLLHFIERLFGVYRWHPTIALRYLPVVEEIRRQRLQDESILEAGSGGLGIAPYLKRRVIGIDLAFPPPVYPDFIPVRSTIISIPFIDQSFSTVVSIDTLEHLFNTQRLQAISELVRVSRKLVIIGVPCGSLAQEQDEKLSKTYVSTRRKEFDFFSEHAQFGLPTADEIIEYVELAARKLKRSINIRYFGTLNLGLRYFLMRGWISDNILVNIIFRKLFLLFIPIFRMLNGEPTYRQFFFITIHD